MSISYDPLETPGQAPDYAEPAEYADLVHSQPRTVTIDFARGLKLHSRNSSLGQFSDSGMSDTSTSSSPLSWSLPSRDFGDWSSSSPAGRSECGSVYDSPISASPVATVRHPYFPSSSFSGSVSGPSSAPSAAVTPISHSSAHSYFSSSLGDADGDTPSPGASSDDRRTKSVSSQSGRDYPVCCLYPGCVAKPFKRRADLDRHYKHRHASIAQKQSYNCDYPRCSRRRDPFHRLDHFRDHLREFHKEDIEKRGGPANADWLEERRVSSTWWRCSKCLKRVTIHDNGYECPHCKTTCQAKRKEARRRS